MCGLLSCQLELTFCHVFLQPWGTGSQTYYIQHFSLLTTTFIFVMGLLFKVNGVSQASPAFHGLSVMMVLLCISFGLSWVVCMTAGVAATIRRKHAVKKGLRLIGPDARADVLTENALMVVSEGSRPSMLLTPGDASGCLVGEAASKLIGAVPDVVSVGDASGTADSLDRRRRASLMRGQDGSQ